MVARSVLRPLNVIAVRHCPLRSRAAQGFEDFFFSRARDVYPRHDFARMADDEYGGALALD